MRQHDRTWSQVNGNRRISLCAIGYVEKQSSPMRVLKAVKLYFTTRYSWTLAWHLAAK